MEAMAQVSGWVSCVAPSPERGEMSRITCTDKASNSTTQLFAFKDTTQIFKMAFYQ